MTRTGEMRICSFTLRFRSIASSPGTLGSGLARGDGGPSRLGSPPPPDGHDACPRGKLSLVARQF
jgi:hypothetical protein